MPGLTGALLLLAVFLAAVCLWLYRRRRRGYKQLADQLNNVKKRKNTVRINKLLQNIYLLIESEIAAKRPAEAYNAIDLLKTAFGEDFIRDDEPRFLAAVIIQAIQAKEIDSASAALDAYRHMLRRLPTEKVVAAAEQLGVIAAVVMREKQNFLAAKCADIVLETLERTIANNLKVSPAFISTLKLLGNMALRRKDSGLFTELIKRLEPLLTAADSSGFADELIGLCGNWLHRIVMNNDAAMFEVLLDFTFGILSKDGVTDEALRGLIKEWQNLAGTACLNPNNQMAEKIIGFTVAAAMQRENLKILEMTLNGAGQIIRLAVNRQGLEGAFRIIVPLLSTGRDLLNMEMRIGSIENAAMFRPQALFYIVRETVAIAEFAARGDMVSTAGDIISQMSAFWPKLIANSNHKAGKRFCQLLLAYWLKIGKMAKKAAVDRELTTPLLLSDVDKQKFSFLQ